MRFRIRYNHESPRVPFADDSWKNDRVACWKGIFSLLLLWPVTRRFAGGRLGWFTSIRDCIWWIKSKECKVLSLTFLLT